MRLRQTAIGVNYIDVYIRKGLYRMIEPPAPIGMEAAGVVLESNAPGFSPGDRVAYACPPPGAYVTMRTLPAAQLVLLPDYVDEETAASEAKAELARSNSCEHPIVTRTYSFAERTRQVSGGRGADVIYDGLGREAAQENLAALATRGHWVSYGQATGAPDPMNLSEKSATLSQPVLFHYTLEYLHQMAGHVFAALRDGILKPEVRRYPLAAAADAHRDLEARRTSGQIVLLV